MDIIKEEIKKINCQTFDDEIEKVLLQLEKTRENYWNIDRESANFLNLLIKIQNSKNVLEIGTSNGYSGIWILEALKNTNGKLTTIEYWEKRQSKAREIFNRFYPIDMVCAKIGQAKIVLEDLLAEIEEKKRNKFDFIFIDANKREYLEYFSFADKILSIGGVILADNILSHYNKVEGYVNLLFNNSNYHSQIFEIGSGMMLSYKDN